jgi:O-antigen/teichoic acid export membrane protein
VLGKESHAKQVLINTLSGVGGFAATALVGLAITPYLIYRLGFESYGFWIVLSTAINYVGLVDGGINTTFIKYVAEYAATSQWQRVRQVITFGVLFYCALALAFAPLAYTIAPLLAKWMKVSPHLAGSAPLYFAAIAMTYFLTNAAGVIGSLTGGIGYLRLVNAVNVMSRIAFAGAAAAFTAYGYGIGGLLLATAVQIAVNTVLLYVIGRRLTGGVFTSFFRLEWKIIKQLFQLGGWIQVTNLASTITMETNRLIIAVFIQTSAVTTYEIANKLTRTMRSVPFNFVVALLPAVSAIDAIDGGESFNRIYTRAARYVTAATMALVGFVMVSVVPISRFWLGTVYQDVNVAVIFLGCAFIVVNLTAVGTCMLRAVGQAKYEAYYFACFAAATIASMFALVPQYRLEGVLAGMLLGAAISTAYFLVLFHRLRDIPAWAGFWSWFLQTSLAGGVAAAAAWYLETGLRSQVFESRLGALFETAIVGMAFASVFAFVLIASRFFDPTDQERLARVRSSIAGVIARHTMAGRPARGRS